MHALRGHYKDPKMRQLERTPPLNFFNWYFQNSAYVKSCVLVFLIFCKNNYDHISNGLLYTTQKVPFFGHFWRFWPNLTPPAEIQPF